MVGGAAAQHLLSGPAYKLPSLSFSECGDAHQHLLVRMWYRPFTTSAWELAHRHQLTLLAAAFGASLQGPSSVLDRVQVDGLMVLGSLSGVRATQALLLGVRARAEARKGLVG
jgi:hypothetical protein